MDQAVWRFIMRQLTSFLSGHAHPCYVEGLRKTGIEVDRIPDIAQMSLKLEKFGWRAIPVSGFIPPAAFMELQSLSYLPIASDMRSLEHLMYTPAPDIVHEAAGHAPILIDPQFAQYLRSYAQVARRAIISSEDLGVYEAIRILSDIKEDPASTHNEVTASELRLERVLSEVTHSSEAALLSRMNWWTAEYGLIGKMSDPKIFGAGLLSSVGEAKACLSDRVKKIPLSLDCLNFAYDITEPQPQLFVTPDFQTLQNVLEELAKQLAFRVGGESALHKLLKARTVNTIELDSGVQISGELESYETSKGRVSYLQFRGPCQLAESEKQIGDHGPKVHASGFGSPIGPVKGLPKPLHLASVTELQSLGLDINKVCQLEFESGVKVAGKVSGLQRGASGHLILVSFNDCTVSLGEKVLFRPEWGSFDMAVGLNVRSAWSGPADRAAFGETLDFSKKVIPKKQFDASTRQRHLLYQKIQDLRKAPEAQALSKLYSEIQASLPEDWMSRLDLLEVAMAETASAELIQQIEADLETLANKSPLVAAEIEAGRSVFGRPL